MSLALYNLLEGTQYGGFANIPLPLALFDPGFISCIQS